MAKDVKEQDTELEVEVDAKAEATPDADAEEAEPEEADVDAGKGDGDDAEPDASESSDEDDAEGGSSVDDEESDALAVDANADVDDRSATKREVAENGSVDVVDDEEVLLKRVVEKHRSIVVPLVQQRDLLSKWIDGEAQIRGRAAYADLKPSEQRLADAELIRVSNKVEDAQEKYRTEYREVQEQAPVRYARREIGNIARIVDAMIAREPHLKRQRTEAIGRLTEAFIDKRVPEASELRSFLFKPRSGGGVAGRERAGVPATKRRATTIRDVDSGAPAPDAKASAGKKPAGGPPARLLSEARAWYRENYGKDPGNLHPEDLVESYSNRQKGRVR